MFKVFFHALNLSDLARFKRRINNLAIARLSDAYRAVGKRAAGKRSLVVAIAGLTFAAASPYSVNSAYAQTPSSQNSGQNRGEAQVTLNLQDVDIRVLINTVAEVSGKNFIVDPRVKGKVSVISGASLGPDQLYDVFLSILEVHNFATVDSGNVIKVLPSNVIKQRPTPTLFSPTEDTNDAQITQIIQLKFAAVQDLVPIVRPLIPPTSHFAPHVPSNSVVLTDTAANIQRVLKIIRRIDIPDKRSNVHVVYLNKTKASDLANTLTQLVTTTADPKDAAAAAKLSIQPLDSINALVVSAPDDQFIKIQALIDELDIERELQSDVNVIPLKHAKAEDLVSILNDVTATATEGAVSAFSVQADEASNSLIVKASGNQLKTVQSVVDKLDQRRAQVFVETVIAEVSLSQAADLGITWGAGGARGGTPDTTDGDGNTVAGTSGLGNLIDRDTGQIVGTGSIGQTFELATGGFRAALEGFKKYNLDVIINAINADSDSTLLSTPTILTLDNEEAEIVVGQEVPFVTGSFNNGFNNNNNNNNDGNTGNTGGSLSGQGFQTIERRDVGIMLKIKPQISDGDTIQLEVEQEISSLTDETVGAASEPVTNRRSIEAIVQVDDGQVVVLGGLIVDDVTDGVSYVPVLGKIPVLGALFRNKRKRATKRNLMVFLKPRIVRTPEQLAAYSKSKYNDLRRDAKKASKNSSKFLIEDAQPAILQEYEKAEGEGKLTTEREIRLSEEEKESKLPKKRKGIARLLLGPKKNREEPERPQSTGEFITEGELESLDNRELSEAQLKSIDQELSDDSESRIDWGKPATLEDSDIAPPVDKPILPIDESE